MWGTGPMFEMNDSASSASAVTEQSAPLFNGEQNLFSTIPNDSSTSPKMAENPRYAPQNHAPREFAVSVAPTSVQRKITEIRVFYDDQTWESFTPKK